MSQMQTETDLGLWPEDAVREMQLAQEIGELLNKHYPGYLWAVNVTLHGGMATIQSLALSGEWGCYIPLSRIIHDPKMSYVIKCGGEILERYRVRRGAVDIDQVDALERDQFRNIVVDAT